LIGLAFFLHEKSKADQCPEMDFLDFSLTQDLTLLLRAIHSLSTGGILKKTRLYFDFKNTSKKIHEGENSSLIVNSIL
jgi:hypothetical protein